MQHHLDYYLRQLNYAVPYRIAAIQLLAKETDLQSLELLVMTLCDLEPAVRAAVIQAFHARSGQQDLPHWMESLLQLLNAERPHSGDTKRPDQTHDVASTLLQEKHPGLHVVAIQELGGCDTNKAVSLLTDIVASNRGDRAGEEAAASLLKSKRLDRRACEALAAALGRPAFTSDRLRYLLFFGVDLISKDAPRDSSWRFESSMIANALPRSTDDTRLAMVEALCPLRLSAALSALADQIQRSDRSNWTSDRDAYLSARALRSPLLQIDTGLRAAADDICSAYHKANYVDTAIVAAPLRRL